MQSDERVSFFVQLEKGKRSFMLRIGDVNEKKVSLMAAMDKFYLVDTTAGVSGDGKKPIVAKSDGRMSVPLIAGHTYQVFKGHPPEEDDEEEEKENDFVKVASVSELQDTQRHSKRKRFPHPKGDRDIVVISRGQNYYAIDAVCYHFGGPLADGDIEDLDGRTCIVCPWHKYKVDLVTGEGIYEKGGEACSKGKKQRVHEVKVENDEIYVKLNKSEETLPSDEYAYMGLWKKQTDENAGNIHSTFQK